MSYEDGYGVDNSNPVGYQYNTTSDLSNWNYNTETGEGPPAWLSTGNLASYFDRQAWAPYGFKGDISGLYGQGGDAGNLYTDLTPDAKAWLEKNNYSMRGNALPGDSNYSASLWNNSTNKPVTSAYYSDADPLFGALINLGVGAVTGGALGGGGLAGSLGFSGGGWIPGAINGAATGGTIAAGNGQNPLAGAAAGAVGGGIAGANPAGSLGVTNPALAKGINAFTGGTLGSLASGNNLSSSVKSGATSGAFAGGGAAVNNFWNSFLSPDESMMASYPLPDNNMSLGGYMPYNEADLQLDSSPIPPVSQSYNIAGVSPTAMVDGKEETKQAQGLNGTLSSITNSPIGNYLGNNAGELAKMLFGMYNNRKQQGALQNQINGLQGLYAQNSPYAQQLRAKLQATAAAQGKRSNMDSRETQLQAMLADRAAQMAPNLYQMQQGQMGLQNSLYSNLFNSFNKMGGIGGLRNLFQPNSTFGTPGLDKFYFGNGTGGD